MSREAIAKKHQTQEVKSLVVVNETVVLENHSEFIVSCTISTECLSQLSYLFVPDNQKLCKSGIIAAHSLVSPTNNSLVPVRIMSDEGLKRVLHKGTVLGHLETLECPKVRQIDVDAGKKQPLTPDDLLKMHLEIDSNRTRENIQYMKEILIEYADVFSKTKMDIGLTNVCEHEIDTGNTPPIAVPPRRVPLALEEKVHKLIEDLLEQGIIQPSQSPWCSPVVIVTKKNGDVRMCIDYRSLNAITLRPIYPIPNPNIVFDTLSGASVFSTLDLSQGYYQVPMKKEDIQKTAFATKEGQFEFMRLPFGLCGAPSTFQRMMATILQKENWTKCIIYLDDVLIFGRTPEEHKYRLQQVLQRIREAGIKLSPSKCSFMKDRVTYLGHVISKNGIETDPEKISKVRDWPLPKTEDQLVSFLGLCGYYRKFIENYAQLAAPLEKLCRKKSKLDIAWNTEGKESFEFFKQALTSAPILVFPTHHDPYVLDCDASHDCVGAVLSQIQNGEEKVIAYSSNKLSKTERQYCTTRKELLAVHKFVLQFKHYLFGRKFTVRTDHKSLVWLLKLDNPNTSQFCRWRADLENFDMVVVHRKGSEHTNADALSRLPDCQQCGVKHLDPRPKRNVKLLDEDDDFVLMRLYHKDLSVWNQSEDHDLSVIIQLIKTGKLLSDKIPQDIHEGNSVLKTLWNKRKNLRFKGDVLYYLEGGNYRVLVPFRKRNEIIKSYHYSLGHIGITKCLDILKKSYYWPGMTLDTKLFINKCQNCKTAKDNFPQKAQIQPSLPSMPFDRIAIDITGPFAPSCTGHRYILGIIDYYSKFPMLIPLKTIDSRSIAEAILTRWISVFGAPNYLHSDRGANFESEVMQDLYKLFNINKTRTTPYHPKSNGLVERLFRSVKNMLRACVPHYSHSNWHKAIPLIEMSLRCSMQNTTKFSPFEVLFGKSMRLPVSWKYSTERCQINNIVQSKSDYIHALRKTLQIIHAQVSKNIGSEGRKRIEEQVRKTKPWKIGDRVFVKRQQRNKSKFDQKFEGPYKIIQLLGEFSYRLVDINGKTIDRHMDLLKPC